MKLPLLAIFLQIVFHSVNSCEPNWYNKCKVNSDCCSDNCEKPDDWEFGVCKEKKAESNCLKSQESGCDKTNCCAELQCYSGPDSTWTRGLCIDEDLMKTINKFINKETDQDYENERNNYLRFVKNYLLDQSEIEFQNTRVKCRELDPKGSYFYRYNKEYSFRICDACKELPIRKLNAARIDENPIDTINATTFDQCFGECINNKMCVASSFDMQQSQCQLFDTVDGKFEKMNDWQTLIVPQPVNLLRDYVYSRNTMIKCVENSTEIHTADSMLDCFTLCEKSNCSLAEFSSNSCITVDDSANCYTTSYKYGHTTLFYKDYFNDDISWRFSISDEEILDSEEDNSTQAPDQTTRTGTISSKKLLRELKSMEDDQYFTECQRKCLNLSTCVGIQFNKQDYDCKMVDVINFNSLATNSMSINYTQIQLIHPQRNSIVYGFQIQLIARYSVINYATISTQSSMIDCIGKCKKRDKCKDILYNYSDQTCLTNDNLIGTNQRNVENNDKWIMLSKNRPSFNQPEFKFTIIGRNKQLANEHDQFISMTQTFPKSDPNSLNNCLTLCLGNDNKSDTCNLVQVERSSDSIVCKLYKINLFNQTINSEDILFSNLYVATLNKNFDQYDFDRLPIMSEEDAIHCEIDKESILLELLYLNSNNQSTYLHKRYKRGLFDSFTSFFKGVGDAIVSVGEAVVETVVDTAKTVVGGVKAVGKLVTGDADGALEEIKETPLYKEGEALVESVIEVGEGIAEGNFEKIGEGLLGVATNDVLGFIPGEKVLATTGKVFKKGITKQGKKSVKNEVKDVKDDIAEKNFKKKKNNDKNDKKDKDDQKQKQCPAKNGRAKRAAGKKRGKNECDDDDENEKCKEPDAPVESKKHLIRGELKSCTNTKYKQKCFYLCNAGYDEKPSSLVCGANSKWSANAGCEPQTCESAGVAQGTYVFVRSSRLKSVVSEQRGNDNVLLYLVLFDETKKIPIYSVAYMQFASIIGKFNKRNSQFLNHPCTQLIGRQAEKVDYSTNNRHKFEKGHLTPADLFRWNKKTLNSGNLYINVAPQAGKFNKGSWKTLEKAVQCASQRKIYAIVATGVAGTSEYTIGRKITVPKYFWKMVCYRDLRSTKTHVALFIGSNEPRDETTEMKKFTLTPRSQKELDEYDPSISTFHNPWRGVQKMNEKFALIARYPTSFECSASTNLAEDQAQKWKDQFSIFNDKKKRSTDEGGFCSKSELDAMFGINWEEEDDDDGDDEDADANRDEEEDSDTEDDFDGNVNVPANSCGKKIVGYYTSWSKTPISASLLSKFTHIIFAFFEMKSDGTVGIGNPDHSSAQTLTDAEVEERALSNLKSLMKNKAKVPGLKVTFAVGGWENSQYFSSMAADPNLKQNFLASVLKAIDEYDFDGVDIDWEYPVTGGANAGITQDKENYVSLLRDLRGVLEAKSSGQYLITFASAAGEDALKNGYDLPELLRYADWVNVMSYDFFGPWASKWGAYTGPPAPLYHNVPKGYSGKFNVNWAIKQYVCDLQSPDQVVMGVPLYGRYWHNVPDKQGEYAMYRLANDVNGKFTGGFATWKDIKDNWLTDPNFKSHFDDKVKCPYAFNQNGTYLGYESPESIKFKIEFAIKSNLGGIMVWAIDQDDDEQSMINQISQANLCTNDDSINFKCIPIKERRWWTLTDGEEMGGLCGKSAPLFRGYYPVCDPDDLGYSCCGDYGFCGSGEQYCDCPTCVNYADDPDKILAEPTKPSVDKITWHFSNAPEGQRGRCGRDVPKVNEEFATCNPDDSNAYCCSNGGYCGQGDASCKCNGCINFKDNPSYTYPPKTWWAFSDGADKSGKCGALAPKLEDGSEPGCDPDSENFCCSNSGYCGQGGEFCDCSGCKSYKN